MARSRSLTPLVVGAVLALASSATPLRAATIAAPGAVARPDGKGDQVIAFYDARQGFTSFVNLRNETGTPLSVSVLLYDAAFDPPFTQTLAIGALSVVTIDVGALRAHGLTPSAGVLFATAVNDHGAPIVSRGLGGSFTVANLTTGAAWGGPALARSAVQPSARQPPPAPSPPAVPLATVIDGADILLPPIQPGNATLASYYDPDLLARSGGGDELVFIAFEDVPGAVYSARAASVPWTFQAFDSGGQQAAIATFTASGVVTTDLVGVAGPGVEGAGGAITFITQGTTAPVTRLIYFSESLGTFSTGYLLPRTGRS